MLSGMGYLAQSENSAVPKCLFDKEHVVDTPEAGLSDADTDEQWYLLRTAVQIVSIQIHRKVILHMTRTSSG